MSISESEEPAAVTFSRWIRDTDSFTQAAARWLGRVVSYRLLSQVESALRPRDSAALGVPAGTPALYRHGQLLAPLNGLRGDDVTPIQPAIVASVRSAVVLNQLSAAEQAALARGDTPLGTIFSPRAVRRHTHVITHTSLMDDLGRQALRVRASLTVLGEPVATVDEIVYQRLLESRRAHGGFDRTA